MGLIAPIIELARLGKADSAQVLARFSGGRKMYFATLHGLEGIITNLGEELHSQYILSYPEDVCSPGLASH